MIYGANGHYDYTQTIAQQIAGLQLMGMKGYRCTYEGNAASLNYLKNLATALQGTGIDLVCCVNMSYTDASGALWANENAAYDYAYGMGATAANALVFLGVKVFQCGNELDAKNGIRIPTQGVQGGVPADFKNSMFPILRGLVNGCMAGVRSVGGDGIKCGSPAFTACSVACSDMLRYGKQPDGTSGYQPCDWDETTWNWYEDYGPIDNMSMDFQKPNTNVLDHLNAYGVPFRITEWNGKASDTDAQRAACAPTFLTAVRNHSLRYPGQVLGVYVYQLINGSPWGCLNSDMTLCGTFGQTVKNFIAANPA